MDWGKFIFLLFINAVGNLPYKLLQKKLPQGINNISPGISLILSFWFLSLSAFLVSQLKAIYLVKSVWVLLLLFLTTVFWFIAPFVIRKIGIEPKQLISKRISRYSVRFIPHTFYLKFFEVLFQQANFLVMLNLVLVNMSLVNRAVWFTVIIGILHFLNIFFLPRREAMIFFVLSVPMGAMFSYLIIQGYILLTFSIHLWFYLVFSSYPWIRKENRFSPI